MRFEWDEIKNRLNQKNHDGIDFDFASRVFADENLLIEADRVEQGEERWHAIGRASGLLILLVAHTQKEEMAKKLSASFQPVKLISKNSEDIFNKPLSKRQEAVVRKLAARQAVGDDSHINYDDIPPLTGEQLARMVRLRDVRQSKVPVSVRLDPTVLEWLKSKGEGHLTRINDILANVMDAERRMRDPSS